MADDHTQRPFRSNPGPSPDAPGGGRGASPTNDPLAELARLIGQNDPFADYGSRQRPQSVPPRPTSAPPRRQPSPEWAAHVAADAGYVPPPSASQQGGSFPPPPELHPAEYAPSAAEYVPAAHEHGVAGYGGGEGGYEPEAYYPNVPDSEGEHHDFYDDDLPPRRRMGGLAVGAVFALAVIGTAGAFGYRALFGSSGSSGPPPVIKADTAPVKIVPAKKDTKNGKLIYDRVANREQGDKLVSREEQPIDIDHKTSGVLPPQGANGMPSSSMQPELGNFLIVGSTR